MSEQLYVEGIPVYFDKNYQGFARAHGVWPLPRFITVGAKWMGVDYRAKIGVLYHEAYHVKAWHKWRRLFALLIPIPSFLQSVAHAHEYAADGFAKSKGFGADLARALKRYPEGERWFHPPLAERLKRLEGDDANTAGVVTQVS